MGVNDSKWWEHTETLTVINTDKETQRRTERKTKRKEEVEVERRIPSSVNIDRELCEITGAEVLTCLYYCGLA